MSALLVAAVIVCGVSARPATASPCFGVGSRPQFNLISSVFALKVAPEYALDRSTRWGFRRNNTRTNCAELYRIIRSLVIRSKNIKQTGSFATIECLPMLTNVIPCANIERNSFIRQNGLAFVLREAPVFLPFKQLISWRFATNKHAGVNYMKIASSGLTKITKDHYPNHMYHVGADPHARDLEFYGNPGSLPFTSDLILPLHSHGGLARVFHGLASKANLSPNKDGAQRRDSEGRESSQHHPESPQRRGLLGREIALFMILAAGGVGICYHAFNRAGKARNIRHTLGWASVVVASTLTASYALILLMVGSV